MWSTSGESGRPAPAANANPLPPLDLPVYTRRSYDFDQGRSMDTFPDLGAPSDEELKNLIQELTQEEQEVSYRRRILHGKIDILRAELVNRLRKKHEEGESVLSGSDVQQLTDI